MIYCGKLRQNTAATKLIGQLFSFTDSKTLLSDALGGNDNFDPTALKCIISQNDIQSELPLAKIKYDYVITGDITPIEALGGYDEMEEELNGAPCYVNSNGFFLWRAGATDWVINETLGQADPGVGRWYSCFLVGQYAGINGFTGTAVVQVAIENTINLVSGGMAKLELTAADTDTLGDLIISFENATEGSEIIFPCSFKFEVIPASVYDKFFVNGLNDLSDVQAAAAAAAAIDAAELATAAQFDGIDELITDKIVECDSYIDTSDSQQWKIVMHKKGDPSTVYASKNMFDINGNAVRSITQIPTKLIGI